MNEPVKQITSEERRETLAQHLMELRKRLLWSVVAMVAGMCVCYLFVEDIYGFLVRPLAQAMGPEDSQRLIYTGLTEAFMTYLKVSLFAASLVTFPLFAVQLWLFIAPGLYPLEKRVFLPFLMATPILFLSGAAFAYYLIIPPAWRFFLHFETPRLEGALPIQLEARISEYLGIVMQLILAFGISFLLPIALILLGRVGLIKARMLVKSRRYAFLLILIVAAIMTPPDILSMLGLALPLYLLYEIAILIVRFSEKMNTLTHSSPQS